FIYAAGDTLLRIPKSGGPPQTIAKLPGATWSVAIDKDYAYLPLRAPYALSDQGAILKVPLAGGEPLILASNQTNPIDIAIDEVNVYWTNAGSALGAASPAGAAVMKVAKEGGAPFGSGECSPGTLRCTGKILENCVTTPSAPIGTWAKKEECENN